MKITFVGIPILFALAIILSATNAYAPCIEGPGINCNNYPPQALTQINSDKLNYEISEKPVIMIVGVPYAVAHLEVDDFSSNVVFSHDINLSSNGTARFILDISSYKPGVYSVIATSIVSKITATFAVGLEPSGHGINPLQSGLIQTSQANLKIIDLKVLPSKVKVGDKFTVTATLVNNSTVPIVVETGKCSSMDIQVPFFTVMFDNHAKIMAKNINCAGVGWLEILDPGKKNTSTSPDYTINYTAIESGTANATVTFQYHVINRTDPTQPNIEQTISKSFQFLIHDVNETYAQKPQAYFASPLQQIKAGVSAQSVKCGVNFSLIIKSENGSPACVKPEHVTRLIQNGWTLSDPFNRIADTDVSSAKPYNLKQVHYYDSSNLNPKVSLYDYLYDGIDKDGLVSINNQAFYQTTLDSDIYKLKGMSVQFHNVTFSFPEGTLTTPGGAFVNLDVKFKDGLEEIYGGTTSNPDGSGSVGGISIPTQYGPHLATTSITVLGNHTMPQAGLTIYKDKIKLLVSYDNHSSLQTIHTVSLGECDVPYESRTGFVPILYMPTGSTGKICVDYSNGNEPTTVTPSVFDARNLSQNTNDISVSPLQANIVHGNSTVVYTITSGNKAGFYGLTIFCYGTPIAIGYDNQSRIVTGDFPWLDHTYYCMLRSYDYHITGVGGGMGIKYVPP